MVHCVVSVFCVVSVCVLRVLFGFDCILLWCFVILVFVLYFYLLRCVCCVVSFCFCRVVCHVIALCDIMCRVLYCVVGMFCVVMCVCFALCAV